MSFEPPHAQFASSTMSLMAEARSEWLDAFAILEIEILRCAARVGAKQRSRTAPLCQKLKALSRTSASPRLGKEHAAELRTLISECEDLLPLRATIVHSRMIVEHFGDAPIALFQNAADAAADQPVYAALSDWGFQNSVSRLRKLAEAFAGIGVSPSSRLQPKRAEAAGP